MFMLFQSGQDHIAALNLAIDDTCALDASFGTKGVAHVGTGNNHIVGLAKLVDATIALAGAIEDEATKTERLGIWRLAANGTIDEIFCTKGIFLLPIKSRATVAFADDTGFLSTGGCLVPRAARIW